MRAVSDPKAPSSPEIHVEVLSETSSAWSLVGDGEPVRHRCQDEQLVDQIAHALARRGLAPALARARASAAVAKYWARRSRAERPDGEPPGDPAVPGGRTD